MSTRAYTFNALRVLLVASLLAMAAIADADARWQRRGATYNDAGRISLAGNAWSGTYIGGSIGYGTQDHGDGLLEAATQGDLDRDDDDGDGLRGAMDLDDVGDAVDARLRDTIIAALASEDAGALGALHIGRNWQSDRWVFGVEGDLTSGSDVDYMATLRARAGLDMEGWLLYATAGIAALGQERDERLSNVPIHVDAHDPAVGYVVGGGLETMLGPYMILGVEGLFSHFDKDIRVADREVADDVDIFTVRVRASYKFSEHRLPPLK